MSRVLVVEDQPDLAQGLRSNLELEGYEVATCADGAEAAGVVERWRPHVVLLDLMLPNRSGFKVLESIRGAGYSGAVLCLTARGEEIDKVRALRSGADDYLTKPFGLMELLARVEALLRRAAASPADALAFGSVTIDAKARSVTRDGREVDLSPKEFELLLALARRPGEVLGRPQLMKTAWGHRSAVVSRTVDTHMAELRRKLEADPARPRHLVTVRKAGYKLVP